MTEARHQLKHLAQAYFHQDYDLEAPTPLDVVRQFYEAESPGARAELKADIESILSSAMSDQEIHDLWVKESGSSYDPEADGEAYRDWFARVLAELS